LKLQDVPLPYAVALAAALTVESPFVHVESVASGKEGAGGYMQRGSMQELRGLASVLIACWLHHVFMFSRDLTCRALLARQACVSVTLVWTWRGGLADHADLKRGVRLLMCGCDPCC
jgi:hypothetical protein